MNETYEIDSETMDICNELEFYDKHKHFPNDKIRIDITISSEALEKIKDKNRSQFINNLIINKR